MFPSGFQSQPRTSDADEGSASSNRPCCPAIRRRAVETSPTTRSLDTEVACQTNRHVRSGPRDEPSHRASEGSARRRRSRSSPQQRAAPHSRHGMPGGRWTHVPRSSKSSPPVRRAIRADEAERQRPRPDARGQHRGADQARRLAIEARTSRSHRALTRDAASFGAAASRGDRAQRERRALAMCRTSERGPPAASRDGAGAL
jgi:hypothetical protein